MLFSLFLSLSLSIYIYIYIYIYVCVCIHTHTYTHTHTHIYIYRVRYLIAVRVFKKWINGEWWSFWLWDSGEDTSLDETFEKFVSPFRLLWNMLFVMMNHHFTKAIHKHCPILPKTSTSSSLPPTTVVAL